MEHEETALVRELRENCRLDQNSQAHPCKNNNDEDFENEYTINTINAQSQSGRISGGSDESAFLSGSEADLSSDAHLSSGRSSAINRESSPENQSLSEIKLLNSNSNLIPEAETVSAIIDEVRVKFLDSIKKDTESEKLYDVSDVKELDKPLEPAGQQEQGLAFRLISRFLNLKKISAKGLESREKEIDEALENLKELLKFRHHYQLSTVLPDQFSREFYILSGMFPFGHDRQNIPVLYLRARIHRRWSRGLDESFRRYVAWQVNQMTKSYSGARIEKSIGLDGIAKDGSFGICFDCLHVSYSCLDMDFLRFLVRVLVQHYPTYCRYSLCVDLPWLFRSVWKLVRSWLPEEAQNTVQLITAKELTNYIAEDQIPNCITFNDLKRDDKPASGKHKLPENWDSIKAIDDLANDLNMGQNEIKQFKSHVEKVRKEYEQLGAL